MIQEIVSNIGNNRSAEEEGVQIIKHPFIPTRRMAIGYDFIDVHKSKITLNIPNMKISILKNFHGTRILYVDLSNVTLQKDS